MQSRTILIVFAAIAATGLLAISNLSISAFAQGKLPESGFGQASKDLATSSPGATGEHSRAGSEFTGVQPFDQDDVPGRLGIGNVAGAPEGGSVGQLGCVLGGLDC